MIVRFKTSVSHADPCLTLVLVSVADWYAPVARLGVDLERPKRIAWGEIRDAITKWGHMLALGQFFVEVGEITNPPDLDEGSVGFVVFVTPDMGKGRPTETYTARFVAKRIGSFEVELDVRQGQT